MGLLAGGYMTQGGGGTVFTPTYYARQGINVGDRCVDSNGEDSDFGQSEADAATYLWVEVSASDTFIRLNGVVTGNGATSVNWFDTSDTNQGTPGVDENCIQLNERVDSMNIFTVFATTGPGITHVQDNETFTDDDKSTFFTLTNDLKYSWRFLCQADDPGTGPIVAGAHVIQFTFRKAEFNDLTVTFRGDAYAEAEDLS